MHSLTTDRIQFSINFYSPEFGISFVAALLLFAEFELRFLIPRGLITRKITFKHCSKTRAPFPCFLGNIMQDTYEIKQRNRDAKAAGGVTQITSLL
jgi:hypothetical protein